jgi:hypothetical protein
MFWFTTFDEVTPASILGGPTWQIAGRRGHFTLIH